MNVGFIGLGIMGTQMARHLAEKGNKVVVWNRSKEKLLQFEESKFVIAESLKDVANECEIVFSCISNQTALEEVYFGDSGIITQLKPDSKNKLKYVIECSTVAPEFVKNLSKALGVKGVTFFDAPVTGGESGAINGTLVSMVGGPKDFFSEVEPFIQCYSKAIYRMGEVGSGQEAKCVNQIAIAIGIAAVTESLFFCQQKGLPAEEMLEILQGGAAGSWAFNTIGPKILKNDFKPGFYAKDMLKDLRITLKEAEKSMTPLPITSLAKELYTGLVGKKGDKLGNHGLIQIYNELVS